MCECVPSLRSEELSRTILLKVKAMKITWYN
jgi:hypothetical protein